MGSPYLRKLLYKRQAKPSKSQQKDYTPSDHILPDSCFAQLKPNFFKSSLGHPMWEFMVCCPGFVGRVKRNSSWQGFMVGGFGLSFWIRVSARSPNYFKGSSHHKDQYRACVPVIPMAYRFRGIRDNSYGAASHGGLQDLRVGRADLTEQGRFDAFSMGFLDSDCPSMSMCQR